MVNDSELMLSIIIPLYNGKRYITDTVVQLCKIKTQKEIIVIDDGSCDDSFNFCKKAFKDVECVKLFSKENGGISSARNYGLDVACGKYIMFVDQDDKPVPEMIDKAICTLEENDCDLLFWETKRLFDSGASEYFTRILSSRIVEREEIVDQILPVMLYSKINDYIRGIGPIWAGIYTLDLIKQSQLQFRHFVAYEDDRLFVFDSLLSANKIYLLSGVGYYWRINQESFSHKKKTIEDYVTKSISSYEYRLKKLEVYIDNQTVIDEYRTYIRQSIILNSIYNVCTYYNINKKETKRIRTLFSEKEYQEAFTKNEPMIKDKYALFLFKLLRKKMMTAAFAVAYLNSIRVQFK